MKELSQITACVCDFGLFLPVAEQLGEVYKRVLFHKPDAIEGFPVLNKCIIGDGIHNVEVCDDLWEMKDEIDLFIFPDIQNSGMQLELEKQGFPVWGSRNADSLEISREKFHKTLKRIGLDVPPHRVIEGLSNLRAFLAKNKGPRYIKISRYRGSLETKAWRGMDEDEGLLDQWAVKFGPAKDLVPFIICDTIETDLELGADTFCVDGRWPQTHLNGLEWKDAGYMGAVRPTSEMPQQIQEVLEAFGPELGAEHYRNAFSLECRVAGDKNYFIDPCARWSLPGTASRLKLIGNIGQIIAAGAEGDLVEPEWLGKFSAECLLTMKGDKHAWGVTDMPKELQPWVKCGNCCEIEGKTCFPPDESHSEAIGWLVSIGDTIEETIDTLHGYADKLPDGVEADTDSLVGLLKEIHAGEDEGIDFSTDETPEPETALNL